MSRKFANLFKVVAVLGCLVAAATGGSNMANSADSGLTNVDFDHAFNATLIPGGESMLAATAKVYLDPAFNYTTITPRRASTQALATELDFDRTFAATALPHRENTPSYREKLREEGWKRILGSR